jgi:carbon dioxide concentrating mechanism protein CcmN
MIPLPMPPSNRPAVISGDVTVHPTANIGNGVLLHANPGSQLIIGVGACIGAGCILHAHTGTLFIGDGVILGMGTLVFGPTQVGERSCIGADSSLIDVSIAPNTVLPPNSLIDSYSSSPEYAKAHPPESTVGDILTDQPSATRGSFAPMHSGTYVAGREAIDANFSAAIKEPKKSEMPVSEPEPVKSTPTVHEAPIVLSINSPIYGRAGLERLLATLRNQR